jgi:aminoglycoside phosphotransferase (APT) family kinase protein
LESDAGRLEFARASFPTNYRIVLTHGDLFSQNSLVESEDHHEVTGIVDWEMRGGYPEY